MSPLYALFRLIIVTGRKTLVIRSNVLGCGELRAKMLLTETIAVNQDDKLRGGVLAIVRPVRLTP